MKLAIIKWLILWLIKHHKFLIDEMVIGIGFHRHKDPKKAKPMTEAEYKEEQDNLERTDDVGL